MVLWGAAGWRRGVGGGEENLLFKIMIVKKSSGKIFFFFCPRKFRFFPPPFSPHHFKPLKLYTSLHLDILRLGKLN